MGAWVGGWVGGWVGRSVGRWVSRPIAKACSRDASQINGSKGAARLVVWLARGGREELVNGGQ